jgi:uncharacterized Fe-S cluster protein YjdI
MTERNGRPSHEETNEAPDTFREQPRHATTVERVYANDQIEVIWEPRFCIHAAECLRGLPAVFDSRRRPWITDITRNVPFVCALKRVNRCASLGRAMTAGQKGWTLGGGHGR